MQAFMNLKIEVRLGLGFGLLILKMATMAIIRVMRFREVSEVNTRIIEKDWVKAESANVINTLTRGPVGLSVTGSPRQAGYVFDPRLQAL